MITHDDLEASLLGKLQLLLAVGNDQGVGIQSDAKTVMTLLVSELIKDDDQQEAVTKDLSEVLRQFLAQDPEVISKNMAKYVVSLHERLTEVSSRVLDKQENIISQINTSKQLESLTSPVSSSSHSSNTARHKRPDIKIEVNVDGEVETHNWGGYGRRPQILYHILGDDRANDPAAVKNLRESVEKQGKLTSELPDGTRCVLYVADDSVSASL